MCEGTVTVYDRHMNIVLGGVTEWCTPFRTVANGGITMSRSKRQRKKKLEHDKQEEEESGGVAIEGSNMQKWEICRQVKQLFIRGDNIIYITPARPIEVTTTPDVTPEVTPG